MPYANARAIRRGRLLAAAVTVAVIGGCQSPQQRDPAEAVGGQQTAEAPPHTRFHYLDADDVRELQRLIPAPVDAESPAAREFEERLTGLMQSHASPGAAAQAASTDADDLWGLSRALGPAFTASNCPRIAEIMARAQADADAIKNDLKVRFTRPRPGTRPDAPSTGNPEQWSYPSGSATRAALRARLLTAIAPEHEQALVREAWFAGHGRMVVGAHLASDVVSGFVLGQVIADRMLESPAMKADLEAARKQWRGVRPGS